MLADSLILNLEFVELGRKELLPSYSAIYYVIEEDDLEIETLAIMLPLRMFVHLLEDIWLKKSILSEALEKEDDQYWKNNSLSMKIAKYLHDEKTTLVELIA